MANVLLFVSQLFHNIGLLLLYGWPFILLFALFLYKMKWKNYPVEAIIFEKRGNNLIKTEDRAGKFLDPYTKLVGYKLHKAKDTIPILNYDWVLVHVSTNNTIFDKFLNIIRPNIGTIFLFRYGSKQYKPVQIKQNNQLKMKWEEVKDNKGNPVLLHIYEHIDPRHYVGNLDFEVIDWDNMNFMVQEQTASIERRKKKSEFWKSIAVPIGMMAITAIIIIVMFKFSYDWSIAMASQGKPINNNIPNATAPNIPIAKDLIPAG